MGNDAIVANLRHYNASVNDFLFEIILTLFPDVKSFLYRVVIYFLLLN